MKQLFLNLKRFDIPPELGGVNRIAPAADWGAHIVRETAEALAAYGDAALFAMFFPEAHIPAATNAARGTAVRIGCQSVYREDTAPGGNFGAFTSNRPANAMAALGCEWAVIGHCEERRDKLEILREGGAADLFAVDRLLNKQAKAAEKAGLNMLYCVGETEQQREDWQNTLAAQLKTGLEGLTPGRFTIAYEPVWAIGPGKTPPNRDAIEQAARFIKAETGGAPLVYGGGLKEDNAAMLASIPEVDGGLIALTRFTGEIGFYPDEYLKIIKTYMEASRA